MRIRCILPIAFAIFSSVALADSSEPVADLEGSADPAGIARFAGSYIVGFERKAFDEYVFATGPLVAVADPDARDSSNNQVFEFERKQVLEGARTRLVYLLPAGRSPLEVLRGYEKSLTSGGAVKRFECAGQACGGDPNANSRDGGGQQSVAMKLWPGERVVADDFSNSFCAHDVAVVDQRFGAFEIPGKTLVQVHAFLGQNDGYCKTFNNRVVAVVDVLELKPREEQMVTLSANEMSSALASTGRVAIYGILFDSASSVIKPESKASLDQIGALLQQNPSMKLHVVGHTDSQGSLQANFALSQARAAAVTAALTAKYAVAAARLTANGVSSLAPLASNADEAGRSKNRRVELVPF